MTIRKDFFLGPTWDEGTADAVDGFCQDVADEQIEHRSGTYTGNASSNTIQFNPALGAPHIIWLEDDTGAVVSVMSPRAGGHITAWAKGTFTLRAASTYNEAGKTYRFFLIASGTTEP